MNYIEQLRKDKSAILDQKNQKILLDRKKQKILKIKIGKNMERAERLCGLLSHISNNNRNAVNSNAKNSFKNRQKILLKKVEALLKEDKADTGSKRHYERPSIDFVTKGSELSGKGVGIDQGLSNLFEFLFSFSLLFTEKSSEITLAVELRACLSFSLKLASLLLFFI